MNGRSKLASARVGILLPVSAVSPGAAVVYVSVSDVTCGGRSPCFTDLQAAVDAATPGDEVRVAAGVYTGVTPCLVAGLTCAS